MQDEAFEYLLKNVNDFVIPIRITSRQAQKVSDILGYDYATMSKLQRKFFKMDCICSIQNGYFATPLFNGLTNL